MSYMRCIEKSAKKLAEEYLENEAHGWSNPDYDQDDWHVDKQEAAYDIAIVFHRDNVYWVEADLDDIIIPIVFPNGL